MERKDVANLNFNFYPKILAMILLLVFIPPVGLIFMYKYSEFDRKTNVMIAGACIAFFFYANYSWFFGGNYEPDKMTKDIFCEQFNENSSKLAAQLRLKILPVPELSGKEFTHEFTPKIILTGKVDGEENFVREVEIKSAPENNDESYQTLVCFGLLAATLNPELDQKERSEIFKDLDMLDEVDSENLPETTTARKNISYSIRHGEGKEIIFTAKIHS